jgi:RNA polymerase sigma factor (sigma-70 family)
VTAAPVVFVIDDDASVRKSLKLLISTIGLRAEVFGAPDDFLRNQLPDTPSCMVLDVRLPGLNGLDFQRELAIRKIRVPIIFITGYGDIPMSVRAMKDGAVEFLTKPFRDQDLLDAVHAAIGRDRARREHEQEVNEIQSRFKTLSSREREVVCLVVEGLLNKQIADQLGTAENTVKVHRSRAMTKMRANSVADLVKMMQKMKETQK